MNYHVLPGDSVASEFRKTEFDGEVVVFRECLVTGDLSGGDLDQFWERRANFLALEYGEDPIQYQESVAYEIERLLGLPAESEVNLWFEYELFCQANMWFCIDLLSGFEGKVFRVEPLNSQPDDIWKGFGGHVTGDLERCFESRTLFSNEDRALGSKIWNAFRRRDEAELLRLGEVRSPCFPFLQEVCGAAAEIDLRPAQIVSQIKSAGMTELETAFPEFQKRAGVYGFGDLQVARLLDAV